MSRRGLLLALSGAAMLAAAPAAAHATVVKRPPVTFVRGEGSYTKASRKAPSITKIVIHTTDGGSFGGNVWWLTGGRSHASAHYVVARDGEIAQLVHLSDIAWHAGNWKTNVHSIGIEHVGETYDPAGFTLDQYRSSAKLVAWLARRSRIPIDRRHIIGHDQVPDPATGAPSGGSGHHTDPGPYWNWKLYMRLVRRYASPVPPLVVRSTTLYPGQVVAGVVPWGAATEGGTAARVDFVIDGEVIWTDHRAPFSFAGGRGWSTTQLANGRHTLEVHAVGSNGKTAHARVTVLVHNHAFEVTTSGIRPWQRVRRTISIRANAAGARTTGLSLYVDGRVVSRDRTAPYRLVWNTHRVGDGRHVVTVAAESTDRRVAKRRVVVVVHNRPHATRPKRKVTAKPKVRPSVKPKKATPRPKVTPRPKPKPKPKPPAPKPKPVSPAVVSQTLVDGQSVQGAVTWEAQTSGPVTRVEFVVDGAVRGTATTSPWSFAWDTSTETPGQHAVTVRALTTDGRLAEISAAVTVVVAPPPAAPPPQPPP